MPYGLREQFRSLARRCSQTDRSCTPQLGGCRGAANRPDRATGLASSIGGKEPRMSGQSFGSAELTDILRTSPPHMSAGICRCCPSSLLSWLLGWPTPAHMSPVAEAGAWRHSKLNPFDSQESARPDGSSANGDSPAKTRSSVLHHLSLSRGLIRPKSGQPARCGQLWQSSTWRAQGCADRCADSVNGRS